MEPTTVSTLTVNPVHVIVRPPLQRWRHIIERYLFSLWFIRNTFIQQTAVSSLGRLRECHLVRCRKASLLRQDEPLGDNTSWVSKTRRYSSHAAPVLLLVDEQLLEFRERFACHLDAAFLLHGLNVNGKEGGAGGMSRFHYLFAQPSRNSGKKTIFFNFNFMVYYIFARRAFRLGGKFMFGICQVSQLTLCEIIDIYDKLALQ